MAQGNRNHKDTLFRDLFGSEERKGYALELYNALNGTSYDDPAQLRLNTIDNALYLGMHNDVSFVIDETMALWEHQSTHNPNMPLRALFYIAKLYSKEVNHDQVNLFVKRRIELPTPQYYVFYIGVEDRPDVEELRLSDSFSGDGCLELVAKVVNINEGRNPELAATCKSLAGYSHLMALIREYNAIMALGDAITLAIDECIGAGVLEDYLRERRAEVFETILEQWDEERDMEIIRKDAEEIGFEKGAEWGMEKGIKKGKEQTIGQLRELGVSEDVIQSLR